VKRYTWKTLPTRWRRGLWGLAVFLVLYSIAGFWGVPRLLRQQIPQLAHAELARDASVGKIYFNPYTLRLELHDLVLSETDGTPLLSLDGLTVDLEWSSLLRRAWTLTEVSLTAPRLHLVIDRGGQLNLARLLAARQAAPADSAAATTLPRLIVERFALQQGGVSLRDEQAGYRNELTPIDFTLQGFSTLPDERGDYSFNAASAHGGRLRWKGQTSMNPIEGSGELVLEDISLPDLSAYLRAYAGLRASSGTLSATLPYHYRYGAGQLQAGLDSARLTLRQPGLALEAGTPPLRVEAGEATVRLQLSVETSGATSRLRITDANLSLQELALHSGTQTPLRLARAGFAQGSLDLAARQARLGRMYAEGGQLEIRRDAQGQLNLLRLLPRPAAPQRTDAPWTAAIDTVALSQWSVAVEDQGTGIKVQVQDLALTAEGASTDLSQPVRFDGGLKLREGGELSARGSVVPAGARLQSEVQVRQLALAPLQPLLEQYVKLRIAGGRVSAQGQLTAAAPPRQPLGLRYAGSFSVDGLALNEEDGDLFAGWRSVGARRLTAGLNPNLLDIPELRIVEPNAKLHINEDRTFNAARLQVRPADAAPASAAPPPAAAAPASTAPDSFAVRVQRIRLLKGKLDFADLSLRPQFAAKVYELNGVVNGLSSRRDTRSQIELDGRVDEFGLARIRGELNPFALSDSTDVHAVFQNVDMVPTSPYTAKFAGYKLAEGKISLDLEYKVHNGRLEGNNRIVMDRLTLGERVDSPDALKLPLELAIAILKDSEGRIDVGLPVSGDVNDPHFSYGALIWKAIGEFIGRIVTAPFRALGRLLGISGEELEAIQFDAGSGKLLPPQRAKLKQVAQLLASRTQLRLSVPAQYSEAADGAALRARAVRLAVIRRAGLQLDEGEEPGPIDLGDRATRTALRELYSERYGAAELDREKKAAEEAVPTEARLPLLQRMGKVMQGEPAVADPQPFYGRLRERLEQGEALAPDALSGLGTQRANAILGALKEDGVDPASMAAGAPGTISSAVGQPVPLKLELGAK
jgi:uncharacterized protein involved in outer membrane biogenesis